MSGKCAPAGAGHDEVLAREGRLLGGLIEAAHTTPPQLAGLVAQHCAAAGLRDLVLQLQDYDQQQLRPMPIDGQPTSDPEPLEASMAGRAFTGHRLIEVDRPDGVRMWAAMLNGTDRVGVLSVTVPAADEATRRLMRRLAGLVADLLITKPGYTAVVDR